MSLQDFLRQRRLPVWPRRYRKGDMHKVKMALRLRRETTMTLGWIADQLQMGTKTHLSHLLYWQGKEKQRKNGKS